MLFEKEASLPASGQERRAMRRFEIRLPALVKLTGNGFQELLTETQNVSARGVFFYIDRPVAPGSKVEITLTLPSHITLTEAVRVRFTARILRLEPCNGSPWRGVAALIEEYEFLRSVMSPGLFSSTVAGRIAK
jgi:PilZ domain